MCSLRKDATSSSNYLTLGSVEWYSNISGQMWNRRPGRYSLEVRKYCTHKLTSHAILTEQGNGACVTVIALRVFLSYLSHTFMKLYTKLFLRKEPHLHNFLTSYPSVVCMVIRLLAEQWRNHNSIPRNSMRFFSSSTTYRPTVGHSAS